MQSGPSLSDDVRMNGFDAARRYASWLRQLDEVDFTDQRKHAASLLKILLSDAHLPVAPIIRVLEEDDERQVLTAIDRVVSMIVLFDACEPFTPMQERALRIILLRWGLPQGAISIPIAKSYSVALLSEGSVRPILHAFCTNNVFHDKTTRLVLLEIVDDFCHPDFTKHLDIAFNLLVVSALFDEACKIYNLVAARIRRYIETRTDDNSVVGSGFYSNRVAEAGRIAKTATPKPVQLTRRTGGKLKIALCVSGQMRGFEKAFSTWRKLGLENHEVRIFVHTWSNRGRRYPSPAHAARSFSSATLASAFADVYLTLGHEGMTDAYASLMGHFVANDPVDAAEISNTYGSNDLIIETEEDPGFVGFTGEEKMYYKIQACSEFARSRWSDYDLEIRIRPDKSVESCDVDWFELRERSASERAVFCDHGGVVFKSGVFGLGDQVAVGTPDLMKMYSDAYFFSESRSGQWHESSSPKFEGHTTLFWNLMYKGIRGCPLMNVKWGQLLDATVLDGRQTRMLIESDVARRGTLPSDEVLLAAC